MTPKLGDDAALREVLLQARRAKPVDRLAQVVPLIEALQVALRHNVRARGLLDELMGTLRSQPVYPREPTMGSEPLVYRWIVAKPEAFHRCIGKIREELGVEEVGR